MKINTILAIRIIIGIVFLGLSAREFIIARLISKIPKYIRKYNIPYVPNPDLNTEKIDEYKYVSLKYDEKNYSQKIVPFLPFEKKGDIYFSFENKKEDNICIYNKEKYFTNENLINNDLIKGIQFIIADKRYFRFGQTSGLRDSTVPKNVNIKNVKFYMASIDDKDDLYNVDFKEVKNGLEIKTEEWPFGDPVINGWGPVIKFDESFTFSGKYLAFKTSTTIDPEYPDGYEFVSLNCNNAAKITNSFNNFPSEFENNLIDIRLEIQK